jgi:hypothetical protein
MCLEAQVLGAFLKKGLLKTSRNSSFLGNVLILK